MSSSTTVAPSHRLQCTPEEAQKAACLNGGTCFAWDAGGGSRVTGCSCTSDWTGKRCELMHIPDFLEASSPITGIALGVTLGGVLIIALVAIIVTLKYIKRKRRRERPTLGSSNHASVSAVHVVDGKAPRSMNGRLHKSNSEFGSVSQQTVSSFVANELTPNNYKPRNMNYETQV